jgi:hypothetical protein
MPSSGARSGDPRLGFLDLGPALLIFALLRIALGTVLFGVVEIAHELFVIDLELVQRAAFFGVVLAPEHLARLHVLALAAAKLDQAPPIQRHHLGPSLRLDGSGAEDGFGDGRHCREAGRDGLDVQVVVVDKIAAAEHCNRCDRRSEHAQDGHG